MNETQRYLDEKSLFDQVEHLLNGGKLTDDQQREYGNAKANAERGMFGTGQPGRRVVLAQCDRDRLVKILDAHGILP